MKKNPERTGQTRKNIVDAFLRCAQSSTMDKVSISEIMKEAGYNRGTFYMYFSDINDLIFQIEDGVIEDLRSSLLPLADDLTSLNFDASARVVEDFLNRHFDRIFLLFQDPYFILRLRKKAESEFSDVFSLISDTPYKDYVITAYLSSVIDIIRLWDERGRKDSIADIVTALQKIFVTGIRQSSRPLS